MKHTHLALTGLTAIAGALAIAMPGWAQPAADATYVATLAPMNVAAAGTETSGEARFEVQGDELVVTIDVKGAPPGITHWQHFHGMTEAGAQAACAGTDADANGDGIVDLIETGPASGTTMVPFTTDPAAMDVAGGAYPTSDADGSYHYAETVSLPELTAAFAKAFDGQELALDSRVVLIHGVAADAALPATVQSLGPIPAATTLPIACGKIERVGG